MMLRGRAALAAVPYTADRDEGPDPHGSTGASRENAIWVRPFAAQVLTCRERR